METMAFCVLESWSAERSSPNSHGNSNGIKVSVHAKLERKLNINPLSKLQMHSWLINII